MFQQILIPLDGSPTAEYALAGAIGIAKAYHTEIELVHVLSTPSDDATQTDPVHWNMRKVEHENYLRRLTEKLSEHSLPAKFELLEGPVAERIVTYADAEASDLIVLSSHGYTGMSRWSVSSVAQKIIARANRSVLLIRAFQYDRAKMAEPFETLAYKRVLVPLDGSRRAECVLPIANKLALAHNAVVWLTHVTTPAQLILPFGYEEEQEDIEEKYEEDAAGYLKQMKSQMECLTEICLLHGDDVPSTLNDFSQQQEIDLMILSAHGRSNSHGLYGSMVTSAIMQGDVSLLVIQDLQPNEIELTKAEISVSRQSDATPTRITRNAQPAFWGY